MPSLLKKGTRQRIEAAQVALYEGLSMAQRPVRTKESKLCEGAIEVGLIGTAAELSISACLYEVLGKTGILRKQDGYYLTASEALSRFKKLLSSSIPGLKPLLIGVDDQQKHLGELSNAASGFSVLFTARATGLHAGDGTSKDVLVHTCSQVVRFLKILSKGNKWAPYLQGIPEPYQPPKDSKILVDELSRSLSQKKPTDPARIIRSIFLVLPEISKDKPEWLEALVRVQIAPKQDDISILIKALKQSNVGDLSKVGKGVKSLPVRVENDNPNALPVHLGNFKKEYTCVFDEWRGEIAGANSKLDQGILDLPHIQTVYRFSALGLSGLGIPEEDLEAGLSAHDLWPYVAAALNYQGTVGPCFFLARKLKKSETGQFKALLSKAGKLSTRLSKRLSNYQPLLEASTTGKKLNKTNSIYKELKESADARDEKLDKLESKIAQLVGEFPEKVANYIELITDLDTPADTTGECLENLTIPESLAITGDFSNRVIRPICEASKERDDLSGLVAVLAEPSIQQVHTEARKAIRDIDFSYYGPKT